VDQDEKSRKHARRLRAAKRPPNSLVPNAWSIEPPTWTGPTSPNPLYRRKKASQPDLPARRLKFLRNTAYGGKDYGPDFEDGDTADVAEPWATRFLLQGRVIELAVATSPRSKLWGFTNKELTIALCNLMAEIALVVQPWSGLVGKQMLSPDTKIELKTSIPDTAIVKAIRNELKPGHSTLASIAKRIYCQQHKRAINEAVLKQLNRAISKAVEFNEKLTSKERQAKDLCVFPFYVAPLNQDKFVL
jgi:hypothetical protein